MASTAVRVPIDVVHARAGNTSGIVGDVRRITDGSDGSLCHEHAEMRLRTRGISHRE